MEDDAVFTPATSERFAGLIGLLGRRDTPRPLYADLAGGFAFAEIGADRLESRQADGLRHFPKLVTNTTCVYMIDDRSADVFLSLSKMRFKGIRPDWFLNGIGHALERRGIAMDCIHGDPPLWRYGSMTGHYASSIR